MKSTIALVGFALISCTALAAQAPSQPPPIPPATDPDVKAFATNTLPTLQEHLKMIEDISKNLHVSTSSGSTK